MTRKSVTAECLECESTYGVDYIEEIVSEEYPEFCPFCGEKIEEFGKESIQVRITKSNKIQSISSLIKSITYSSMRKFVIILENGQKWKQLDSDYRALLPGKKYEKVTIKRGALGSYNLIFDGSLPSYKAKRIE